LDVVFTGLRKTGHFDLEAVEMATRTTAHQLGAKVLERLLSAPSGFEREVVCPCGQQARFREMRPKQLTTVVGPITTQRPYYVCGIAIAAKVRAMWNWMCRGPNTLPALAG